MGFGFKFTFRASGLQGLMVQCFGVSEPGFLNSSFMGMIGSFCLAGFGAQAKFRSSLVRTLVGFMRSCFLVLLRTKLLRSLGAYASAVRMRDRGWRGVTIPEAFALGGRHDLGQGFVGLESLEPLGFFTVRVEVLADPQYSLN